MPALRIVALVAAAALCIGVEGVETETSSCSSAQQQQMQTLVGGIRASLESDAASSSKETSVPTTCKEALTFDLSAANEDNKNCANDCIAWIENVVDASTCGDEEMLVYQRRVAAYLAQCNEHNQVTPQENEGMEHSSRLRGLAAGSPDSRKLGVKGLMDALLVVTLNNAI